MISELLYNGIDLVVGVILVVLYYLNVPFVVEYIFEIFIAVFAVRYFLGTSSSTQTSCSSRNASKKPECFPKVHSMRVSTSIAKETPNSLINKL